MTLFTANQLYIGYPCGIKRHQMLAQYPNYQVLFSRDSIGGRISVVKLLDYEAVVLRCDHSLMGGYYYNTVPPTSIYSVFDFMALAPSTIAGFQTQKSDVLLIGVGAGVAATELQSQGANVHVVEINPVVVQAAQNYFNLTVSHKNIFIQDGVEFVKQTGLADQMKYDNIIHDIFSGGQISDQQLSAQNFGAIKRILRPARSVLTVNIFTHEHSKQACVLYKSLSSLFNNVRIFSDQESPKIKFKNLVYLCSNDPITYNNSIHAMFHNQVDMKANICEANKDDDIVELGHWQIMNKILSREFWVYAH